MVNFEHASPVSSFEQVHVSWNVSTSELVAATVIDLLRSLYLL